MMDDRCRLMHMIQVYDFNITEANLFLDTHPKNQKALAFYTANRQMRKKAVDEYESKYGPLTINGNKDPNCWRWIDDPWPWEGEV